MPHSPVVIPLDGTDWSCKGYVGEEWSMRRAFSPDSNDVHGWVPARVPGSVLDDLVRAGVTPDPLRDLHSLACEWVPERTWVYRREVVVDRDPERAVLEFDGIDHVAQLYINGEHVGTHVGPFTPARFDVGVALRRGRNLIAVVIGPAPDSEPHCGRTQRVRVLKSRMTYGWDFCPRIPHLGIWDRARLVLPGSARVTEVAVRPRLSADLTTGSTDWQVDVEVEQPTTGTLRVELLRGGEVVASDERVAELGAPRTAFSGALHVDRPELWWPNGYGDQPLYEFRVTIATADHEVHETVPTAFRHVELVANRGAPQEARAYTFVVNGQPIYIQGWNWVPMDVHHGVEDDDRLDHLLGLAARAGTNLLRVWGGGLIEKRAFYERCDRLGLMVWQEFPLSSSLHGSVPSDDPGYVEAVIDAARTIVPRRRNHPSLVLWCGGNELDGEDGRPADGSEPVLAGLEKVVAELDPDRAWLPTSPTGPQATFTLRAVDDDPRGLHDVHGPWEHQGLAGQHELYARATSLFHSEFGVEGMANVATIEAYLSPEHRWPADRSNPHIVHRGDFWINTPLIEDIFGPIDDLPTLVAASQLLQADGLRAAIESNRRRQWRQSGSIPWQLNEPFPNVFCTSAVDQAGRPKAAYHAVAEAYRDVVITAALPTQAWGGRERFEAAIWASSRLEPVSRCHIEVETRDAAGVRRHHADLAGDVPGGGSVRIGDVRWPVIDDVPLFWLDVRLTDGDGRLRATTRWLCSSGEDLRALRELPPAQLELDRVGDEIVVRNRGGHVAVGIQAHDGRPVGTPGHAWFDTGNLTLFPGEDTTILAGWIGAVGRDRPITVTALNTEPITLA